MIIKYDNTGTIQWARAIGGKYYEELTYIISTNDDGFIVAGTSSSPETTAGNGVNMFPNLEENWDGCKDGIIVKYDKDGEPLWGKTIGEKRQEQIYGLKETKDGGFLVAGYFGSPEIDLGNNVKLENKSDIKEYSEQYDYTEYYLNGMIIKYDSTGMAQWARTISGNLDDEIRTIEETEDGGILAVGAFYSPNIDLGNNVKISNKGGRDALIIKYDSTGKAQWAKAIGGSGTEILVTAIEIQVGGYLAVGTFSTSSIDLGNGISIKSNGGTDGMIIKYDVNGTVEWSKAIGGTGSDSIFSILETKDDGYILRGSFTSPSVDLGNNVIANRVASYDGWTIKYARDTTPPTIQVGVRIDIWTHFMRGCIICTLN